MSVLLRCPSNEGTEKRQGPALSVLIEVSLFQCTGGEVKGGICIAPIWPLYLSYEQQSVHLTDKDMKKPWLKLSREENDWPKNSELASENR